MDQFRANMQWIETQLSGGRKPGDSVTVMPDDYGKIGVRGEIVALSSHHIAIRRNDPQAGEVVVHFPRAGFLVLSA